VVGVAKGHSAAKRPIAEGGCIWSTAPKKGAPRDEALRDGYRISGSRPRLKHPMPTKVAPDGQSIGSGTQNMNDDARAPNRAPGPQTAPPAP
jgi:hypothetical protein